MDDLCNDFANLLDNFIKRNGRAEHRLSRMTEKILDGRFAVPNKTINNWRGGVTKKPQTWQQLCALAQALKLSKSEADCLLQSTGYPSIDNLNEMKTDQWDQELLSYWSGQAPVKPPAPFQAPRDVPNFVGRQRELAELKNAALSNHGSRLYYLTGMGGVGKSSLAIRLAYLLRPLFTDGVLWIQRGQTDPMTGLQLMAKGYNEDVSQYSDIASRASRVRDILKDKRVLLIIDDVGPEDAIAPLLPSLGSAFVIVTSRLDDIADMHGGVAYTIAPFDPLKSESLLLFSKIMSDERVQAGESIFIAIAKLLGELPLAIVLAAHWLNKRPHLPASALKERLEKAGSISLLRDRYRSVRLTFDLSYDALPSAQQHFFAALWVFAGESFDAAAAAFVVDIDTQLAEDYLVDLGTISLIQAPGNGRYSLHPLLREFSRQQKQDPNWLARMVTYYIDLLAQPASDYLDQEVSNVLAALDAAQTIPLLNELLRGVLAAYRFLRRHGHYARLQQYLQQALEIVSDEEDLQQAHQILLYLGHVAQRLGESESATTNYEEALTLAQLLEEDDVIRTSLLALGAHQHRQGKLIEAGRQYEAALPLADVADRDQRIALLTNLGLLAADRGEFDQAETYYQNALALAREETWRPRRLINVLHNYGGFLTMCGRYDEAHLYLEEGSHLARESGDAELQSRLFGNWGLLYLEKGEPETAVNLFEEGLHLAQESGHVQQICRQLTNMGRLAIAEGEYIEATNNFQAALKLAQQIGTTGDAARILIDWGEAALLQSDLSRAESLFQDAQEIAAAHQYVLLLAESLFGRARVLVETGNGLQAQELAEESLSWLQAMGHVRTEKVKAWLLDNGFTSADEE